MFQRLGSSVSVSLTPSSSSCLRGFHVLKAQVRRDCPKETKALQEAKRIPGSIKSYSRTTPVLPLSFDAKDLSREVNRRGPEGSFLARVYHLVIERPGKPPTVLKGIPTSSRKDPGTVFALSTTRLVFNSMFVCLV